MTIMRWAASVRSGIAPEPNPRPVRTSVDQWFTAARWIRPLTVLTVLLLSGCMGARLNQSNVERRIGHATSQDIIDTVPKILGGNGYTLFNTRRTDDTIYFETTWRNRVPFDDEAERGAEAARTRIILRARRSSATLFTVRLEAQNEVSGISDGAGPPGTGWSTIPATDDYKAYILELSTLIKLEVDAGSRRVG